MPNVFNWQIGREMDYPYEPSRPKRQFAMIMDLNKCIACQTCTVACKTNWTPGRGQEYMFWNNVESKPYGFYPLGWDVRILEKHGVQDLSGDVYKGKTLFEAAPDGERVLGYLPDDIDYANPNVGEDDSLGDDAAGRLHNHPAHAVDVLPAAHLQSLHIPCLSWLLPAPVDLQASGRRDCAS